MTTESRKTFRVVGSMTRRWSPSPSASCFPSGLRARLQTSLPAVALNLESGARSIGAPIGLQVDTSHRTSASELEACSFPTARVRLSAANARLGKKSVESPVEADSGQTTFLSVIESTTMSLFMKDTLRYLPSGLKATLQTQLSPVKMTALE